MNALEKVRREKYNILANLNHIQETAFHITEARCQDAAALWERFGTRSDAADQSLQAAGAPRNLALGLTVRL